MIKIYIVRGSSGEYSDHTEWDVVACTTKSHANKIAGKLRGLGKHNLEHGSKLLTEFETPYKESHPTPPNPVLMPAREEFRQMQRISKKTCGDDVRALWKKLDQENTERVNGNKRAEDVHSALMRVWNDEFDAARAKYEAEHYSIPEHLKGVEHYHANQGYYSDASYGVHEVELIDDQEV